MRRSGADRWQHKAAWGTAQFVAEAGISGFGVWFIAHALAVAFGAL